MVQIAYQLAIFLENTPGAFARVCETLGKAGINIYAVSTGDTVDHNVVRLVVSEPDRALKIFEENGSLAIKREVLMLEIDHKPGYLATISKALATANINIEYCYCATAPGAKKGLLIMKTSDSKKTLKVLNFL